MGDTIRLNKFLASTGPWSRRGSEELITAGRVRIDGTVVREQGVQVDPDRSVVEVDGKRVEPSAARWLALHKPPKTICTRSDPRGRPTVYGLLRPDHAELFHVGRLDLMSEGLLLFTNDGDVAQAMLHPSSRVPRRYEVTTSGEVPPDLGARLQAGVQLEDGLAKARRVRVRTGPGRKQHTVDLTLHEGRNREIRRLMKALDIRIDSLKRVSFGPIELGRLKQGSWRTLGPQEVRSLRALNRPRKR
ncbi:MAG: pseudouridine synthase [Gemmatimonadota bacterium]